MSNDETRQRFLAAINERIATVGGSIDEAHVFQSMKQGIMETGVAVVATSMHELPTSSDGVPSAGGGAAAQYTMPLEGGAVHDRRIVYTARYRLTLKGPDRGKWEFSLHPEADAPLLTVDKVVRGVQQRSGDAVEPTRLGGEEIRAMLPEPQPQATGA